ncbi:MAG TPA: alcohol dehydrogenase catalytic domain-containing protein [Elusimicrobiota bacterium]|jgi:2-desacetyl-2-hydroxyethyl bacteriochlorophyllide A dehydrogenase|nr:alcohol dehydrogenase catalytic domain-containing protein [Elusimicrobiota bacterium]
MKALVFHHPKDVRVESVPDPRIENARDVIVRVTSASITGEDLRVYNGHLPQRSGLVLGREFMGVVVETGPRVRNLRKGDRVVVPPPIACGECFFCARGLPTQCEKTGGASFGRGGERASYDGGQAQYVRVPFADVGPRKVPDGLSDERALFLSDTLPAAWAAAERCELKGGETVAVFGCGPAGLMAMRSARLLGAARVIAVDVLAYRRAAARRLAGAETLDPAAGHPPDAVRRMTGGRGADACIDAVGMEAEYGLRESVSNVLRLQVGTIRVLRAAISAVRRGGVVSVLGAYGAPAGDFPIDEIYEKGLRLRAGPAPVHAVIDRLLDMAAAGRLAAEDLVTHRLPLDEAPEAYVMCSDRVEDCLKVVLKPWEQEAPLRAPSAESDEFGEEPLTSIDTGLIPPSVL